MTDDRASTDGGAAPDDAGLAPSEVEPDPNPPADESGGTTSDRADPSDMFVPRDEQGNIAHVETEAEGLGTVVVQPLTYGEVERYLGDAGTVAQADPSTVATILREHVIDPNLNEYAKENFRDEVDAARRGGDGPDAGVWFCATVLRDHMNPYAPQALLMAILRESGMNVDVGVGADGSATIEFDDEGN